MNNFKGETTVRVGMPAIIHELLKDKSNKTFKSFKFTIKETVTSLQGYNNNLMVRGLNIPAFF